jgi:hypothetical protein
MLGWATSWWSSENFTGPARNAPNSGINIRQLFDQKPTQVMILSQEQVIEVISGLRPTKINAMPPLSDKPPIMKDFDNVFECGYKNYFQQLKEQRKSKSNSSTSGTSTDSEVTNNIVTSRENISETAITESSGDISDVVLEELSRAVIIDSPIDIHELSEDILELSDEIYNTSEDCMAHYDSNGWSDDNTSEDCMAHYDSDGWSDDNLSEDCMAHYDSDEFSSDNWSEDSVTYVDSVDEWRTKSSHDEEHILTPPEIEEFDDWCKI